LYNLFQRKTSSRFARKLTVSLSIFLTLPLILTSTASANTTEEEAAAVVESFFTDYENYAKVFSDSIKNKPIVISGSGGTTYADPKGATKTVFSTAGVTQTTLCKPPKKNGDTVCFTKQDKSKKWSKSTVNSNDFNFTFNGASGIDATVEFSLFAPLMGISGIFQEGSVDYESISYTKDNGVLSFAMTFTNEENEDVAIKFVTSFTKNSFKVDITAVSPSLNGSDTAVDIRVVNKQKIKFPAKKNIAK
jgi:hypothetical protein